MESVTLELTYPGAGRYTLTNPLAVSLVRTLESPAQSLSITLPMASGNLPGVAVGATLRRGSQTVFSGFCDQQTAREDRTGRTFTVQARSRGALVLDNEALPQTYYNITTSQLFRRHLRPYGFTQLDVPREVEIGIFTVPKGMCEWEVFSAFCDQAYGRGPIVGAGERVIVQARDTDPVTVITNRPERAGLRYLSAEDVLRRASAVSELLLRDKQGNYSRLLENPFGNPWQVQRRRYVIPAAEYATIPLADGYRRFLQAQRGTHTAETVLPGWADLWPGDCVQLDTGLGDQGRMTVWRCRWDRDQNGEYTTVTLTPTRLS